MDRHRQTLCAVNFFLKIEFFGALQLRHITKMIGYFYSVVLMTVSLDDEETLNSWSALKFEDMREWVEDQLDLALIPKGAFRESFLAEMFHKDSEDPYDLWSFIMKYTMPRPEDS